MQTMTKIEHNGQPGFSLMEMLVVVGIIALLAMIAAPNFMQAANRQTTRSQAMDTMSAMRQARLKAATSSKPVRVVVDCPANAPCVMRTQMASYDLGVVAGWADVAGSRTVFDPRVRATRATPIGTTPDGGTTPDQFTWIIFTPEGKALSNPRPFGLYFTHTSYRPGASGWKLTINNNSGRAALNSHTQ
jgi:prepilin-type N-terminal cleavage/methylation domain-containing protein